MNVDTGMIYSGSYVKEIQGKIRNLRDIQNQNDEDGKEYDEDIAKQLQALEKEFERLEILTEEYDEAAKEILGDKAVAIADLAGDTPLANFARQKRKHDPKRKKNKKISKASRKRNRK